MGCVDFTRDIPGGLPPAQWRERLRGADTFDPGTDCLVAFREVGVVEVSTAGADEVFDRVLDVRWGAVTLKRVSGFAGGIFVVRGQQIGVGAGDVNALGGIERGQRCRSGGFAGRRG